MTLPEELMFVRPKLSLLTPEQMNEVHRYSVRILEETGVEVESNTALQIFAKSGGVKIQGNVVFINGELVDHALIKVPSNIEIFNKSGDHAFHLGQQQGDETHFGIGATNTWFLGIEGRQVELFKRKHMQHSTRLGDMLEHYAMISTPGIPSDVPVAESDLYSALDMYANTSKPMVLLISGKQKINDVLGLLSFLHGDITEKPFCIPYVNPITPLVLNKDTSDKMIASIEHNLPLIYSNYSMYGGTAPITEGGILALLNAELLAGLVFSQLIREGSKVILGSLPAAFNMSTMGSIYTTTSYLLNLASAEMMNFYQVPHCGTSGSNIGRGPDLLASAHLLLNHFTSCMGKVGCAPFVGGNFESLAFSPTTVVLSNHLIGEARKFARGFALNDETVNLGEINRVGHGGDYFTSEQTLAALTEMNASGEIWHSLSLAAWKERNMPTAEEELIEATNDLYSRAVKASEEAGEIIEKGEEFIARSSA